MANPEFTLGDSKRRPDSAAFWSYSCYVPLLIPIILFVTSIFIPPIVNGDSGVGFRVLHNMFAGGAFNTYTEPDPNNIANDHVAFVTLWSPGQYLVPATFIWLGTNYGVALSLTALLATLAGLVGWIQVARSFAVSSFALFIFVLGLSTFYYVLLPFRIYNGGEVLLFAAAPWSVYAIRWAADKPPVVCFAISLLLLVMLFFAKLTGLVVFAANVGAISLLALATRRRLTFSILAMWVASAIGALCFRVFWLAHGPVAATGETFTFSWFPIWFSVTGITFSGTSALDFLSGLLRQTWGLIFSDSIEWNDQYTRMVRFSYTLGPLGLLLIVWVWLRLRHTRYRDTAVFLLTVILLYAIPIAAMYLWASGISLEDRHFRYAGILFFLLLLMAIDQWRVPLVKGLASMAVIVLGLYGLKNAATDMYARAQRVAYYDPTSGIYQEMVSPTVLQYMRSEATRLHFQRPIAVVPSLSAAISLPQFRIIYLVPYRKIIEPTKWVGRAQTIFVVVPEDLPNHMAETILRSFTDYDFRDWREKTLDGMVIYTQ
jgi:hypothetical protein